MKKVNVTCRLDCEAVALLDELAQLDDRDRSYLVKTAIDNYVNLRKWQIEEVKKAIIEADAGDFASDKAVKTTFAELAR